MLYSVLQRFSLARRFLEHPVADFDDQPGFFGQRNKFGWADQAALRVLPADQRFGLVDAAGRQVHDRLEINPELVGRQRTAQVVDQPQPGLCGFLHGQGEIAEPVAALALGDIHRLIGVLEQIFYLGGIVRIQRDADAGRYIDHFIPQLERFGQFLQDVRGYPLNIADVVKFRQNDGELVTAQTCHGVGLAHTVADAARRFHQQDVAHAVAERVVDLLEVVEVDEQQRHLQSGAIAPS